MLLYDAALLCTAIRYYPLAYAGLRWSTLAYLALPYSNIPLSASMVYFSVLVLRNFSPKSSGAVYLNLRGRFI